MSRKSEKKSVDLGRARDELFSHIHRCGVLGSSPEQQEAWMEDTIQYIEERYPDLSAEDLEELKGIGLRFCRPVIDYISEEAASEAQDGEGTPSANGAVAA